MPKIKAKNMKAIRKPAVAGQFYPSDADNLRTQISDYFSKTPKTHLDNETKIVLSPHAGYVFSGQITAESISKLNRDKIKTVFILADAHSYGFKGISINTQEYETPLGVVSNAISISMDLLNTEISWIKERQIAHLKEHCIEVELPFLQYHLSSFSIIPILFGDCSHSQIKAFAEVLSAHLEDESCAFVISTDFSHYPESHLATEIDNKTAEIITSGNPMNLIHYFHSISTQKLPNLSTPLCGFDAVLCAMYIAETGKLKWEKIKYANSGVSNYGDKDKVVGYWAIHAYITDKDLFKLNKEEREFLLSYAREVLKHHFSHSDKDLPQYNEIPSKLQEKCGAFVSIYVNKKLRGCIGRFSEEIPLINVVHDMTLAAAFQDSRFPPIKASELESLTIEISVLTPLMEIQSPFDFELGKHGIYIQKNNKMGKPIASGTFLPHVASDSSWNKEEFLGHCARDKAGIGWDGWRDANIYIFETITFSDQNL
jgi:MEMO1 family protein